VALQVSFLMSTGRSVWIQALLYVLLGGGFLFEGLLGLIHSSESRTTRLPKAFKWHSLFAFVVAASKFKECFVSFSRSQSYRIAGFAVFSADIAKFFFINAHGVYGFLTVVYLVLLVTNRKTKTSINLFVFNLFSFRCLRGPCGWASC
jgi:hypothetical protein